MTNLLVISQNGFQKLSLRIWTSSPQNRWRKISRNLRKLVLQKFLFKGIVLIKLTYLNQYSQMKVFGKKQVRGKRPEARKMSDRKVEKEKYEKSSEKVL